MTRSTTKEWWTVFAVYDDNQEPYIEYVQAKDKADARSKALQKADGVILIAGIAQGKILDADVNDLDNIVPIRGKGHAVDVTLVRITSRKLVIPGRCPQCRADLRRSGALHETMLNASRWSAHLSWNGKDLSAERDGARSPVGKAIECVGITCTKCSHNIWNGLGDE